MGSPPFALAQIDHIVLRVRDGEAMSAFYCDVLGCSIERRQDAIGLLQLRAGKSLIDLVPVDGKLGRMGGAAPGAEGRNLDHVCLRIEPFDLGAIQAHLRAHGITIGDAGPRYGAEGEGPSQYLADPEGNVVELKGPPDAPRAAAVGADATVGAQPSHVPGSWVMRVVGVMQREPVLFVTVAYLFVSFIGLWANYWFYRRFGLPIIEFMQGGDLLVSGLREPAYALVLAAAALFTWLMLWPERWRRRHPARAAELQRRWWGKLVFPGKHPLWSWWGMAPETGLVFGVVWLTMWCVMAYVTHKAQDVRNGGGQPVRITLAGAPAALPGDARLLGTTSGYVFVWWPDAKRAEALVVENVGRIETLRKPARPAPPTRP